LNSDSKSRKKKKRKNNGNNGNKKANWVVKVSLLAFVLSVFFSFISETVLNRVNIAISLFLLLIIVAIGIIFDIIGIAVTSADEAPFHAMAAKKVKGGKEAVKLIRNADIVSNICNDVVGDICGILSGAAGATIVTKSLMDSSRINEAIMSILMAGIISTLTIGGKAKGKSIAINNSKKVVYDVALILHIINKRLCLDFFGKKNRSKTGDV